MNFNEALLQIYDQLSVAEQIPPVDRLAFITFATEDKVGGYDAIPTLSKWPIGSMWGVEGQVLYALVRALKPAHVLEFGTFHGCSATHIASALRANGKGKLTCVDNGADGHRLPSIGHLIPDDLREWVTLVNADMVDYVRAAKKSSVDLILEDGMHSPADMKATWEHIPRVLKVGGVALSHDAMHPLVGEDVRQGIISAGITDFKTYLIEPADCGFAVWRKGKV